jgi:protein-histidine pros-kinase
LTHQHPALQLPPGGLATAARERMSGRKEKEMKLILKFNLVLIILFAMGIAATAHISRNLLESNAREEVYENAKLLIDSALAVRDYTNRNIAPLLETQIRYDFRPEMVAAFSANEVLKNLREKNPEYQQFLYREATLNPTNPANKAVDWENDIVNGFRNGAAKPLLSGERDTPNGRMLFVAKALKVGPSCLRCHNTAETAPPTLIAKYGSAGGFGWKVDEIVAAQIIQVPKAVALARADATFRVFMASVVSVLLVIGLTLNLLLWWMFIRPVTTISALADRISLGDVDAPDFVARGRDEIGLLAESLSRMRRSLVQAIRMLEA